MRKLFVLFFTVILLSAISCGQNNKATPEANKEVVREYLERLDKQDMTIYDELTSPDAIFHSGGSTLSFEEAKQMSSVFFEAFPDLRHEILDLIAEGDKVVLRATDHGTHKGEFNGIPPTDKEVSFGTMAIYRIEEGKIAEFWGEYDMLGLMTQLGMELTSKMTEDEKTEIAKNVEQRVLGYMEALKRHDADWLLNFWADVDEFVFASDGELINGYEKGIAKSTREGIAGLSKVLHAEFKNGHTYVLARDAAVYTTKFDWGIITTAGDTVRSRGSWSYVLKQLDGEWKTVHGTGTHIYY